MCTFMEAGRLSCRSNRSSWSALSAPVDTGLGDVRETVAGCRSQLVVTGRPLVVERAAAGRWTVLLSGFSRFRASGLTETIATAVGAQAHDAWVMALACRIESSAAL